MAQSLEDGRARERHLLLAVSHDLRTPLTSIRGFAEAIQDGAIEDSGHAADVIIAESRRLERLVGDLLDLTKLEAGQMSISMRPTDAAELVSTTAEAFRPAADKSGRQIVVDVPGVDGGDDPGRCRVVPPAPRRGGSGPARPALGKPHRERAHVRPFDSDGVPRRSAGSWNMRDHGRGRRAWHRTRGSRRVCSNASTEPTAVPIGRWGLGSVWPSWPSWRRPWAALSGRSRRSHTTVVPASS